MRSLRLRAHALPVLLATASTLLVPALRTSHAQTPPINGMREADPGPQAIVGATVVVRPGTSIERAVVLVRDGRIERVGGADLAVPAGYRVWSCEGLTLYAGLVEPSLLVDASAAQIAASGAKGAHWNRRITPQVSGEDMPPITPEQRESLRALGFTAAQVLPERGLIRGVGSIVLLSDDLERGSSIDASSWLAVSCEYGGREVGYPGSLMGSLALERQTFLDAHWYAAARDAWTHNPSENEPPQDAVALEALLPFAAGAERVLFDATSERDLLRQARVAGELSLDAVFLGSGTEFRRLAQIAALRRPFLIPPRLPRTPDVSSPSKGEQLAYEDLLSWELAPTNAARLESAGVPFAFTSAKLEDRKEFRANIRTAIEHGLSPDAALAAVTTRPAELLGQAKSLGSIEGGKLANLVLVDGALFGTDEKEPGPIRAVWVAGRRHEVEAAPVFTIDGRCQLVIDGADAPLQAELDRKEGTLTIVKADGKRATVRGIRIDGDRFGCTIDGELFGREGTLRCGGVAIAGVAHASAEAADGSVIRFRIERLDAPPLAAEEPPAKTTEPPAPAKPEAPAEPEAPAKPTAEESEKAARAERLAAKRALAERPIPFPFGPYGLMAAPRRETVLFRNATIWTEGPAGILAEHDLLVQDGRIAAIGRGLAAPAGARVVDATGRHLTPGLIDCHSHTGIDGGVNEFAQANTAECEIADCIDAEDVNWYRQLAGGLTAANQLHGSANPMGGRNSVVRLRWGEDESAFRVEGAIPGIKFALGENVTRSANRYPGTRMGVETFMRDAFEAARRYDAARTAWNALPPERRRLVAPPRPDLELDALVQILRGERIVHCHSYRQDEILMLIRLAESFGFRIGTFQHVLEGYKVADEIARHGAGASSFSDWWAYKMEVYDAIPHNGAILTGQGAVTSFNSDSAEVARHMNTEAAKAVRYGGLDPHEALKLVTINPAKQLRIDSITGSLEVGKAADVVLWTREPLSIYARVDETWVDGALRFSRAEDAAKVEAMRLDRQRLLAAALAAKDDGPKRGKAGSRDAKPEGDGPKPSSPPPSSLLARMLDSSEAWYFELVRRGLDPDETRPGECGCGTTMMNVNGGAR